MKKIIYILIVITLFGCPKDTSQPTPLVVEKPIVELDSIIQTDSIPNIENRINSTLIKSEILFYKDTTITSSLDYDIIEVAKGIKVVVKGKYWLKDKGFPIAYIKAENLILNEGSLFKLKSLDTKVIIDEIDNYRGQLSFTAESKEFDNGITLNIGEIRMKYADRFQMFFQNIKGGYINSIVVDSAMYNKDGSDATYIKHGVNALKWDNARSPEDDKRKFKIGSYIVKNTNFKDSLFNEKGEKVKTNLIGLWLDEGANNVSFDYGYLDMPLHITSNNEYNPKSTGNHHFKYLELTNRKPYSMSTLVNSRFDDLVLNTTFAHIKKSKIGKLTVLNSPIFTDTLSIIKSKKLDKKSKLILK